MEDAILYLTTSPTSMLKPCLLLCQHSLSTMTIVPSPPSSTPSRKATAKPILSLLFIVHFLLFYYCLHPRIPCLFLFLGSIPPSVL